MVLKDSSKTILSGAKQFFSGTALSRFTGMMREVSMAAIFGASPSVAAFMMAFRFSNLFRRLFGEGAMQNAFVPHFENIRRDDPQRAGLFFRSLSLIVGIILLLILLISEAGLFCWLRFGSPSADNVEVIKYTMLMMPGIIFVCLFGLNAALMQCERKFFLSGAAPVAFNLIWIFSIIFLRDKIISEAMFLLAAMVTVAFAGQWFITVRSARKILYNNLMVTSRRVAFSKELVLVGKALSLAVLGVAATQINGALDVIFARTADASGPAYLWYAIRLQQTPLALFGLALAGALLPPLSRAIKNNEGEKAEDFLRFAIKRNLAIMVPCTFGLIFVGSSIVNLIYGRGNFDAAATSETIYCLWAYAVGLCPMTLVLIFAATFYSRDNYIVPTIATIIAVLCNIVLNALFIFYFRLGSVSVAFATSISSVVNLVVLYKFRYFGRSLLHFALPFVKIFVASALAGLAAIFVGSYFFNDSFVLEFIRGRALSFDRIFSHQLVLFFAEAASFGLVLLLAAKLLRVRELFSWLKKD